MEQFNNNLVDIFSAHGWSLMKCPFLASIKVLVYVNSDLSDLFCPMELFGFALALFSKWLPADCQVSCGAAGVPKRKSRDCSMRNLSLLNISRQHPAFIKVLMVQLWLNSQAVEWKQSYWTQVKFFWPHELNEPWKKWIYQCPRKWNVFIDTNLWCVFTCVHWRLCLGAANWWFLLSILCCRWIFDSLLLSHHGWTVL